VNVAYKNIYIEFMYMKVIKMRRQRLVACVVLCSLMLSSAVILPNHSSATEVSFTLNSWEVKDDSGYPSIYLNFDVTDSVTMQLTNPEGVQADYDYVNAAEHGVYMHLASYKETPEAGTYELVVTAGWSDYQIFSKQFSFEGASLSIVNVQTDWEYSNGEYNCNWIKITVNNSGDLPTYPDDGTLQISDENDNLYFSSTAVMPNEQKILEDTSIWISLPHGIHSIDVTLKDYDNNIIASYSGSVTIQSAVDFTLNSWRAEDNGGYPSIYLNFDVNEECKLKLIAPDGITTDYEYIKSSEHGAHLHMAGYHENPGSGKYKIEVTAGYSDNKIFSKSLTFAGPNASIYGLMLIWEYKGNGVYKTTSIFVACKNGGDLPAYVRRLKICVGTDELDTTLSPLWDAGMGTTDILGYTFTEETDPDKMLSVGSPGKYTVTATIYDSDYKKIDEYTQDTTVTKENEAPSADFTCSTTKPKAGETVDFTDLSADNDGYITSWQWNFGDGNSDVVRNPSHRYDKAGTYTITLTVTDNDGDTSSHTVIITVEEEKETPGFELSILIMAIAGLIAFRKRRNTERWLK